MEDDNVIYVQVDEQGRVINYTSNTSISDQIILLQEDGKEGNMAASTLSQAQGTSTVQTTTMAQAMASPTQVSTTTSKSAMLNLASLPSGIKLVGASPPGAHIQTGGGVRIAPKPATHTPLSPVLKQIPTSTVVSASPQRITINPQKLTINPQKITINPQSNRLNIVPKPLAVGPQKITLNPGQTLGNLSIINAGTTGGQLNVTPSVKSPVLGTQSIITPTGVKQVSLLGPVQRSPTKVTIKGSSPGIERISLDQLVNTGGVTLQRLPTTTQTTEFSNTRVVTAVNSTTGVDAVLNITQQPDIDPASLLSQPSLSNEIISQVQHDEGVAYAKPDTTTDEATLLSYQSSEVAGPSTIAETMETDELPTNVQALTSNSENALKNDSLMNVMISDSEPAQLLDVMKPTQEETEEEQTPSVVKTAPEMQESEDSDELMDFLAENSKPISDPDTLQNPQEISEDKSANEAPGHSEEEEDYGQFPAGLIRGEPVKLSSSANVTSSENKDDTETDYNDELVPIELNSSNARKNRLPLAVQSEASDTDSESSETDGESTEQDESSQPRMRGRPRKTKQVVTPDAPDISEKKDFMKKNFNLFTPRELEEQRNKRRSARISNAEILQQADAEIEREERSSDAEKSSTHRESDDTSRQNIFDILGNNRGDTSSSDDPQKHITKLQSVNTELKGRIRQLEQKLGKSPQTKYKEKAQMKMIQAKLERSERMNEELLRRLSEFEGKDSSGKSSPPEQKFDMTRLKHGGLSFTPGSSKRDSYRFDLASSFGSGKHENALLRKKEQRVKALHHEIDYRTSILRAKESKLQRMVGEIKERENKVGYREHALTRRVQDIEYRERILEGKTKAAIEKRNKQGGAPVQDDNEDIRSKELLRFEMEQRERDLKRREDDLRQREEEAANKEKLLKVTEQELHELHIEIKQEYDKSHSSTKPGEFLDTPRSAYLSKVGATPLSGRSTRPLRHTPDTRSSVTPVKANSTKSKTVAAMEEYAEKTQGNLSERKRKSIIEETPMRSSRERRGSNVSRQSSRDSKQEEFVSPDRKSIGRGRPRKTPRLDTSVDSSESATDSAVKARPSRGALKIAQPEESTESTTPVTKRGKPDTKTATPTSERRGRGRPPKKRSTETPTTDDTALETETDQPADTASELVTETEQKTETEKTASESEKGRESRVVSTERRGRGRPKKSETKEPELHEEESGVQETQQTDVPLSSTDTEPTERRGRGRPKRSGIKPKTEENTSADESSSTEPPPQLTKEQLQRDEYDFEGSSQSDSEQEPIVLGTIIQQRAPTPLSGTKVQDLKQGLKSTKKPRGAVGGPMPILRKRSRSHSASPAPSEGKRQKQNA